MFDFCDRNWAFIFKPDMMSMIVTDGKIIREMGTEDWWEALLLAVSISTQRDEKENLTIKQINWSPNLYVEFGKGKISIEPNVDEEGRTKVVYRKGKTMFIFARNSNLDYVRPYKLIVSDATKPDDCYIDIEAPMMNDVFRIFTAFLTGNFVKDD